MGLSLWRSLLLLAPLFSTLSLADNSWEPKYVELLNKDLAADKRWSDLSVRAYDGYGDDPDWLGPSCIPMCNAKPGGNSAPGRRRRSIDQYGTENDTALFTRDLENPTTQAERDTFVHTMTEGGNSEPIFTYNDPTYPMGSNGAEYFIPTSKFALLAETAINWGAEGLCGCTLLVIVSPRAAYMAHYWEQPGFTPDLNDDGSVLTPIQFNNMVINFMSQGFPQNDDSFASPQDSIAQHANDLAGGTAYIMTPKYESERNGQMVYQNRPKYYSRIPAMISQIQSLVPNVQVAQPFLYERLWQGTTQGDQLMDDTSRGRALFQFDPQNRGRRTWRVYFQSEPAQEGDLGASN